MTTRPFASTLLAAILGAVVASIAVVFLAGGGSPSSKTAAPASTPSTTASGARREVASTALTATQIYKQASPGAVSIRATTAQGGDSGTGIVLNDKA